MKCLNIICIDGILLVRRNKDQFALISSCTQLLCQCKPVKGLHGNIKKYDIERSARKEYVSICICLDAEYNRMLVQYIFNMAC